MGEFHSRPIFDWNDGTWKPKCPYCEVLDWWNEGKPIENVDGDDLTAYILFSPRDGWLLVDSETAYPIDHCPMCGRKLDKNAYQRWLKEMTDKDFNNRLKAIDSRLSYCKDDGFIKLKLSEYCVYNFYSFISKLYGNVPLEMFLHKDINEGTDKWDRLQMLINEFNEFM